MTADIIVRDLFFSYPPLTDHDDPVPVLRGVDFQVARGEFVALLGRVGAGKTTLCMTLNGLVPHATGGVFRGDVTVLGKNTKQQSVADMARFVGMVFQDPESQLVQMRVEDEVAFGPENLGVPSAEIEKRVTWALEAVGLAQYRDRSPLLLSGGEMQRLAIASMLAMHPQILVLDEPTASLDPAGKAAVFEVLVELRERHGITILMATQELERIAGVADRLLVLNEGQIALEGPPVEVFKDVGQMCKLGLGVPQLAELAYLLNQRTGSDYWFITMPDAYKKLRRQARKVRMRKAQVPEMAWPAGRVNPLADDALIRVEKVSHVYKDGTVALRDVSFRVPPGDFVALIGPNGSGKTTLAKHLDGLLKPTSGRVMVERRDTRSTSVAELARLVGYVFQNPDHQIFAPTVREEIAFGPRMMAMPEAICEQRVAEALDRFRLTPYADVPPALLGYGQRRQVALAAVIATQPKALILDEPTGGLDSKSQDELLDVIVGFHTQGRTVILITHDMRLVAEHANRAMVLLDGRLVFDGTPRELFNQQEILAEAGLDVPPVMGLANRLSGEGMAAGVLTAPEFVSAWQARLPVRHKRKKKARRSGSKRSDVDAN